MLTGNARSPQAEPVRTRIPDGLKFSPFSSRKKSPSEAINPKLGKSKNENTLRYSASAPPASVRPSMPRFSCPDNPQTVDALHRHEEHVLPGEEAPHWGLGQTCFPIENDSNLYH